MKTRQIISEGLSLSVLAKREGRFETFLNKIANGEPHVLENDIIVDGQAYSEVVVDPNEYDRVKSIFSSWDGGRFNLRLKLIHPANTTIPSGKFAKTDEYKVGKGISNRGYLAEAFLGAATYVRLKTRDRESITVSDVEKFVKTELKQGVSDVNDKPMAHATDSVPEVALNSDMIKKREERINKLKQTFHDMIDDVKKEQLAQALKQFYIKLGFNNWSAMYNTFYKSLADDVDDKEYQAAKETHDYFWNAAKEKLNKQGKARYVPEIDNFELYIQIPSGSSTKNAMGDFIAFDPMKNDEVMNSILTVIVRYVNNQAKSYAKWFSRNERIDKVIIRSDGVSEAAGRKTDVEMIYRDVKGNRATKHFTTSVKTGSTTAQFSQKGAGRYDKKRGTRVTDESWDIISELMNDFGVNIETLKERFMKQKTLKKAYGIVYSEATKMLKRELSGRDEELEKKVIQKMYNGIMKHTTKHEPNVKIVKFTEQEYLVLDMSKLERIYDKNHIDLDVAKKSDPSKGLSIVDKNSGKSFLTIQVLYHSSTNGEEGRVNNLILMGPAMQKMLKQNPRVKNK